MQIAARASPLCRPAGRQRRPLHALRLEQESELHGNLLKPVEPPALAAAGSEGGGRGQEVVGLGDEAAGTAAIHGMHGMHTPTGHVCDGSQQHPLLPPVTPPT